MTTGRLLLIVVLLSACPGTAVHGDLGGPSSELGGPQFPDGEPPHPDGEPPHPDGEPPHPDSWSSSDASPVDSGACTPDCAGKACGSSDGCGGTCQPGSGCCTPACAGKACGSSDGCGGTCQPGSGCCGGMASGFSLPKNKSIASCGGKASLSHQSDGNVVVYQANGTPLWSTNTAGKSTTTLAMQGDGNLVLYGSDCTGANGSCWSSGTASHPGATAAIQDDCNFVVYSGSTAVWASGSWCP